MTYVGKYFVFLIVCLIESMLTYKARNVGFCKFISFPSISVNRYELVNKIILDVILHITVRSL